MELKQLCLENIANEFSAFMKLLENEGYSFTVKNVENIKHIELVFNEADALIHIDLIADVTANDSLYLDLVDAIGYGNYYEVNDYIKMFYVTLNTKGTHENIVSYKDFQIIRQQFQKPANYIEEE